MMWILLITGPWSVGAVIEDYVGAIFAWGIIVNGSYLPGSFTYAYGFLQVRKMLYRNDVDVEKSSK